MEKYFIKKDIRVFYVTASSFPDGIMDAYQKLYAMLGSTSGRQFYGISNPGEDGAIVYKAAVAEAYAGEAENYACKVFIIPPGEYISELLTDWKKDMAIVEKTFRKLLDQPQLDKNGFCLEIYIGENDMRCMVP